jgi:hypothetical protein
MIDGRDGRIVCYVTEYSCWVDVFEGIREYIVWDSHTDTRDVSNWEYNDTFKKKL